MDFSKIACERNCSFIVGGFSQTCMYYPPIYDKEGRNTNLDRNHINGSVKCGECKKEWKMSKLVYENEYKFEPTGEHHDI